MQAPVFTDPAMQGLTDYLKHLEGRTAALEAAQEVTHPYDRRRMGLPPLPAGRHHLTQHAGAPA